MTTARYLIQCTFWAALIPAMIVSIPGLIVGCFSLAILVILPLVALLYYGLQRFFRRFDQALRSGDIPSHFLVRHLPFFLPLFYALIVAAVGLYLEPTEQGLLLSTLSFGMPHYLPSTVFFFLFHFVGGMPLECAFLVPLIASLLMAVVGPIYVSRIAPPSKCRVTGMVLLLTITFALAVPTYQFQKIYRENLLPVAYYDAVIVQDEASRRRFGGDETDLADYQPFSQNNKLVSVENPTLTIESEHPKIDGATALYPVYAAAVQAIYRNVTVKDFELNSFDVTSSSLIHGSTTPKAFARLLDGKVDLIVMAQPSQEQLQDAAAKGKTLSMTPIGNEAFVFFVSKDNPVKNLSSQNIRDIYSKRITNWSELGGKNERILAFQRPDGSGSQTAMRHFMAGTPLADPVKEEFQEDMGGIVHRVADYRNFGNSIGYSFRYYVEGMSQQQDVKLLSIDGVAPTVENIRNKKYPFTGEFFIITAGTHGSSPTATSVQKLIDWFLSPQGQDMLERVGYVPMAHALSEGQ